METDEATGEVVSPAAVVAGLIQTLYPSSVLLAGHHSEDLVARLQGVDVVCIEGDQAEMAALQLGRRFDLVVLIDDFVAGAEQHDLRAVMHAGVQHLLPSGAIVTSLPGSGNPRVALDSLCAEFDLDLEQRWGSSDRGDGIIVSVHRRSSRYNVHDMLFEARSSICRLTPRAVLQRLGGADPPLVVDTRTATDRMRFGVIEGAIHVPRTVVEWHLDPANGYRHPAVQSFEQPLVVVCSGGYSSSLSAANLVRIGFTDVADMIGGMAAWLAAGLPVVEPTESHLGF